MMRNAMPNIRLLSAADPAVGSAGRPGRSQARPRPLSHVPAFNAFKARRARPYSRAPDAPASHYVSRCAPFRYHARFRRDRVLLGLCDNSLSERSTPASVDTRPHPVCAFASVRATTPTRRDRRRRSAGRQHKSCKQRKAC